VRYISGAASFTREGVYHARLRRLGIEGRWSNLHRSFESMEVTPPGSKKRIDENLPC